jgi:hypothetical protein
VFVSWEASEATPSVASAAVQSLVQRFALCLIRRAPLAIGAQSAPQIIYIDSQSVCALFVASAARHNQKTKHHC